MKVKVTESCPTLCDPMDYRLPGSSVHWIFQARILVWVAFPPPGDLPDPGIKPRSPTLQVNSLPAEPPGKPKNIGVGNLSLLQRIFLTQELNPRLQHCGWFLYQLSYQGYHMVTFSFILDAVVPGPKLQLLMHCRKQGWFLGSKP